jgi:hypothetical protein
MAGSFSNRVDPVKAVEDMRQMLSGDTRAGIRHDDFDLLSNRPGR